MLLQSCRSLPWCRPSAKGRPAHGAPVGGVVTGRSPLTRTTHPRYRRRGIAPRIQRSSDSRVVSVISNRTGLPVILWFNEVRSLTRPAVKTSRTLIATRSQPRSLLSIAILNSARSRALPAISRRTLMDQTCRGRSGRSLTDDAAFVPGDADRTKGWEQIGGHGITSCPPGPPFFGRADHHTIPRFGPGVGYRVASDLNAAKRAESRHSIRPALMSICSLLDGQGWPTAGVAPARPQRPSREASGTSSFCGCRKDSLGKWPGKQSERAVSTVLRPSSDE